MYYSVVGTQLVPCPPEELSNKTSWIALLTPEEAACEALPQGEPPLTALNGQGARFCKAEVHPEEITGTFCIPVRDKRKTRSSFCYTLRPNALILVDDTGIAAACLEKIRTSKRWKSPSAGRFFYDFLEALTTGDVIHLEELENRIAKLETAVLSGTLEDFNHKMLPLRKEVMDLTHYYTQLEELGAEMEENETGVLNRDEVRLFHLFGDRMGRLREETQMLREYSMQVREVYQSQIDLRQNKIMKILTVVTTLFLPLTLVAGWYGMNFDMPEFSSPFGYPAVILLSAVILSLCVWLMKKKKFW